MPELTELHEDLARIVVADRDLDDVLGEVTTIARRAVPHCESASITLIRGEKAYTAAHDGQMALDADEMQYERGYGPCLDAGRAGQVFVIQDMATEQRWPDYARHAAERGVGSSLSVPLPFQTATIGALNTYASNAYAFGDEDRAGRGQRRRRGHHQRGAGPAADGDAVTGGDRAGEGPVDGAARDR